MDATIETPPTTTVVHAVWSGGRLHLWSESAEALLGCDGVSAGSESDAPHPFAAAPEGIEHSEPGTVRLHLPSIDGKPLASKTLALSLGQNAEIGPEAELAAFDVPTAAVGPLRAGCVLEALIEHEGVHTGDSVLFYASGAHLGRHLLARQRFVPMLMQDAGGGLSGTWSPWLPDDHEAERVAALSRSIPGSARAAADENEHDGWAITQGFLHAVVDAGCRAVLDAEEMNDTIEDLDPVGDAQIAWLSGLLMNTEGVPETALQPNELARTVRRWIGGLDDRGESTAWRLGLRLNEPLGDKLPDRLLQPGADVGWSLSFFLESIDDPETWIEASDIWLMSRDSVVIEGLKLDSPHELMLSELARAARLYPKIESCLDEHEPIELLLSTKDAYAFLREHQQVLAEQGITIKAPAWWDTPGNRLGARLQIEAPELEEVEALGQGAGAGDSPQIGLGALVDYHWQIAVGSTNLTLKEFEQLAIKSSPLVRIGGQWVEIRPEDVKAAVGFIKENPGGKMPLVEAMHLAFASDTRETGVPVMGMETSGWVASLFGGGDDTTKRITIPDLETPTSFRGELRPYQQRGLSWLAFMERFGFGACLADDMGLGKTIQLLALMLHEREAARDNGDTEPLGPTLLVVPMSVVGNWGKETEKFAPELTMLVHHGVDRLGGELFVDAATSHDMVITTYALANRDRETLESVKWRRIVLDEAQFIKNPQAKQSQAVRSLAAPRRITLTGTPVENRLSELWSIMDFLNPGYLGNPTQFRKRFGVPIERYRDQHKMDRLRGLIRPFILRRVKTDPSIAAELPEKIESKVYLPLMPEQVELYQSCVKRMLSNVEGTQGIHRRGLVLAALIKLKQICNHPSQFLKDHEPNSPRPANPHRSGKSIRLLEMLDEVLAEGDRALIFTQFRQMGHLLASMLRHELGREVMFLHGGTPQGKRTSMVENFQDPQGRAPILILSLKAGGVGLNLTAATHVFHYDRWWNPAVENQATDRAYRIGQTRAVQVHKFIVQGTLEERIDEMIESKIELAENIIGSGERWLTDLDTEKLRDLLTLRADAMGDSDEP